MENTTSAIALNLSNQSNMYRAKNTSLFQMNAVIILGLSGLDFVGSYDHDYIPVSFAIEKSGDVTISGIDIERVNDDAYIHSDKKTTFSKDMPDVDNIKKQGVDNSHGKDQKKQ